MKRFTNRQKHDEVLRFFCVNEMSDKFMPFKFIEESLKNYGYSFRNNQLLQILDKLTDDKFIKFEKITHAQNGDVNNCWRISSDGIDFFENGGYEGKYYKDVDEEIIKKLQKQYTQLEIEKLKHEKKYAVLGFLGGAAITYALDNQQSIREFLSRLLQ